MVIISEFAPNLPPKIPPNAQNGGRVQSITVNPTDSSHIIVANQFGGLWKTTNGGENWFHLDGLLTIFVRDVAYGPDGDTVIATVARDNWAENGGGIWLSHNGGQSWSRPSTGDPHNDPALPNRNRVPERITAYGIQRLS